jgi:hypothetical protein
VSPRTPMSLTAARTSSSLNGLMIAVMSFIRLYDPHRTNFCVAESTACASMEVLSAISSLRPGPAAGRRIYAPVQGTN